MVRAIRLVVPAAACVLLAGCSSATAHRGDPLLDIPVPRTVIVQTATVAGLGSVLTDSSGHTLYMFPPDAARRVTCTGACAGTWPPLVIAAGHRPSGRGGADAADLDTVADPNTGAMAVTYRGHPLYRYAGDLRPGQADGQKLVSDGGPWYALRPDGTPITTGGPP